MLKRLILVLMLLLAMCTVVQARQASFDPFDIQQPDGSVIRAFVRGDEFQGWTEAEDTGHTILQNKKDGYWEYAEEGPNGKLRNSGIRVLPNGKNAPGHIPKGLKPPRDKEKEKKRNQILQEIYQERLQSYAPAADGQSTSIGAFAIQADAGTNNWPARPVSGNKNLLVVLINFADATLTSGSATYWNNVIFDTTAGAKSAANFFKDNSFNTLTINPVSHSQGGNPAGIITVTLTGTNHPNCGQSCPTESSILSTALTTAAAYLPGGNLDSFDTNGNGYVGASELMVYFVLAGYEAASTSLTPNIWAHASGGLTVGSKTLSSYSLGGEKVSATDRATMGVVPHELGHSLCGLPDLYDTSYTNGAMGIFSLMASGTDGADTGEQPGTTPTALDIWSREYLGWATAQVATAGTLTLPFSLSTATTSTYKLIQPASATEYFLLENRQPVGWDRGMRRSFGSDWAGGLLVTHIDNSANYFSINNYTVNQTSPGHQGVLPVQASTASCNMLTTSCRGHKTILFYNGNNRAVTPLTTPSSDYYSGTDSNISLTGISAPASTMTANLSLSAPVLKTITVNKSGAGSGTVTSTPAGINCGGSCSTQIQSGLDVVLTASSSGSSVFTGWSGGGCSGTGSCTVTVADDVTVTANFAAALTVMSQNFDTPTAPNLPTGWTSVIGNWTSGNWIPRWITQTAGSAPPASPHSSPNHVRFNSNQTNDEYSATLVSPQFSLSAFVNGKVKFWMYRDTFTYGDNNDNDRVLVYLNTTNTLTGATLLGTVNRLNTLSPAVAAEGWYEYSFDIPASFNGAANYLLLHGISSWTADVYVDDISVVGTDATAKTDPTLSVGNSPVTYNGSAQSATVNGSVAGTVSNVKYNGLATVPTNAGTYAVTADFAPTNTTSYNSLTGASAGNFVINKANASASVSNGPFTYDGSAKTVTVACVGGGAASNISPASQTNAGTFSVTADCAASSNYNAGTTLSAGSFVINKATASASVSNGPFTYDGSAKTVTVACVGGGAASSISPASQTNAGTYSVTADCAASSNYNAGTTLSAGSFVINKGTPTASVSNSPQSYDGSAKTIAVSCLGGGAASNISPATATTAGSYPVTADCGASSNYNGATGLSAGSFVITDNRTNPTISVANSPATYNGSAQSATVSGSVAGVVSNIKYNGSATAPTNAGTYAVTADFVPSDTGSYNSLTGASAGNFVINKANASASVSNGPFTYDGSAKTVTVSCLGGGAASNISPASQTNAGTYSVTADCSVSGNYNAGTDLSAGSLVINKATPTASVSGGPFTYDGSIKTVTVSCLGGGAASNISPPPQKYSGTYSVTADCGASSNYNAATGLSAGSYVINKANQTASVTNSPATYDGSAKTIAVACSGGGAASNITPATATSGGSYPVTADCAERANYYAATGLSAGNFVITDSRITPTISVTNSPVTYMMNMATWYGIPQAATVSGSVPGTVSNVKYNGSTTLPINAGTYAVTADFTPTDTANYSSLTGASAGNFVINKKTAFGIIQNPQVTYDGTIKVAVISVPAVGNSGIGQIRYNGVYAEPTNAGTYEVVASIATTDPNLENVLDTVVGTFVINKANASASVSNGPFTYDGNAKTVAVSCLGGGIASNISPATQTNAGTYSVTADCAASSNYNAATGLSAGSFVITKATPTASVSNSPATYDGNAKTIAVACLGGGAASNISPATATTAGSYPVTADCGASSNYNAATTLSAGNFVIDPASTVSVTVTTSPAGQSITVDGSSYTAPQTFSWQPGSSHTIATTATQNSATGSRYAFANWSDSGALSHSITAPASGSATYTASFTTEYQFTSVSNPAGTADISPPSGTWYPAGSVVTVKSFPKTGYMFVSWSGPVANSASAVTTVTMNQPVSITSNNSGIPALTGMISGKSGTNPRTWNITVSNNGQGTATSAQVSGLSLTQTYGTACTPVINPAQFPRALGDIPVGSSAVGAVTIDFGTCASTARFTAAISYGSNGGAISGVKSYTNQFR
jgi:M6 family metalloprotease-like protein